MISSWLREQKKDLQIYANTELLQTGTWQKKKQYLKKELAQRAGEYFFFFVADKTGKYSTTLVNQAGNVSDRKYFKQVMKGKTVVSGPLVSKSTGRPIIVAATPLTAKQQVEGLLGAVIRLTQFTEYVNHFRTEHQRSKAYVISDKGIIMAHPQSGKLLQSCQKLVCWKADLQKPGTVVTQGVINGKPNYIFQQPIPRTKGWKLIVNIPKQSLSAAVVKAKERLLSLGLITLLIVAVISLLLARRISQPIIKLRNIFNQGATGDLTVRADLDREDEIGQAADSFDLMMEKLNDLKYNDPVTGLANISYFKQELKADLEEVPVKGDRLAVFAIGVDNLKDINDSFSYLVGDEVLQEVAARLTNCSAREPTVCRISDEFFLYVKQLKTKQQIVELGQELLDKINYAYQIEGEKIYLTASVGIAIYPEDSQTEEGLIKNASMAMHLAKQKHEQRLKCYSIDMENQIAEKLSLENKLIEALQENQFFLHYQPLLDTETKKIKGVEALIRWQHPTEGRISPGKFIPLAEENGMIVEIGEWVLTQACRQLKEWQKAGYDDLYMSVNIAPEQFQHNGFVAEVREILADTGVDPEFLELEITERATIENADYTIKTLNQLQSLGVKIAIDDFGTGYSSLNYLKEFALNTLKIDQSFINELNAERARTTIAETIITIGHNLGLEVVAEGVETEDQLQLLQQENCDLVQGYYFSYPLPSEELQQLLADNN